MVIFPNAKINIGLNIVEKRKDNFHNIETVFYPIGLKDILEVIASPANTGLKNKPKKITGNKNSKAADFTSTGTAIPGKADDNLCLKVIDLLKNHYDIPEVKIHLHKVIPIGAGLGGGSSDAAHLINLADSLFSLNIPLKKKLQFSKQLGSDCSFFIRNKPVFAYGRGDKFMPVDFSLGGYFLVLVHPPIHVSTKDAYSEVKPQPPAKSLKKNVTLPVETWKDNISNQFEETVFRKFPGIGKIKNQLYALGAVYASMSGSGSSVYGIFSSLPAEGLLKKNFRNCYIWNERLMR